jgi:ABC-2 type transport system permease protein
MKSILIVLRLTYLNLRTQMEYRFQFWVFLIIKALSYLSSYLTIWLILSRFQGIASWSIPEVMVLWALVQLTYTLAAPFYFHSIGKLDEHIVKGTFDHYLTQPINPLVNLIARNLSWTYTSQIALNAGVLIFALQQSGFEASASKVVYLGMTILGGLGFQSFTFLLGGAMSFRWTNAGGGLSHSMRWFSTNLTQYPLSIYPRLLRWLLTFIIPAALINYYPAIYLLGKSSGPIPTGILWLAPGLLVLLGYAGYRIFRYSLRMYQGAGG